MDDRQYLGGKHALIVLLLLQFDTEMKCFELDKVVTYGSCILVFLYLISGFMNHYHMAVLLITH